MFLGDPEFLMGCLTRCVEDPFDKKSNKEGFVNLGTAVNSLCEDIIKERLDKVTADDNSNTIIEEVFQGDVFRHEAPWQHYMGLNGTEELLSVVAQFLSDRIAQVRKCLQPYFCSL